MKRRRNDKTKFACMLSLGVLASAAACKPQSSDPVEGVSRPVTGFGLSTAIPRPITNGFGVAFPQATCGGANCGSFIVKDAQNSVAYSAFVTQCSASSVPVVYAKPLASGKYTYSLTVCGDSYSGSVTVGAKMSAGAFHVTAFGDTQHHTTGEETFDGSCIVDAHGSTLGGYEADRADVAMALTSFYGANRPGVVIHLGDLGLNSSRRNIDFYEPFSSFLQGTLLAPVVGNHDWWSWLSGEPPPFSAIPKPPTSLDRAPVGEDFDLYMPGQPKTYANYSFDYRNVHFLMLDTGYDGLGAISPSSLQFVHNDLGAAHQDNAIDFIVVAMHKPLYASYCKVDADFNDNPAIVSALSPLFTQFGVDIVLGGHNHNYQHRLVDGIHHYIAGTGGGIVRSPFNVGSSKPAIAKADELGFLDIHVDGTQITTQFHPIDGNISLPVFDTTVIKKKVKPPLSLKAEAESGTTKLSWTDKSASETGFVVEFRDSVQAPWQFLANVLPNITSYSYPGPNYVRYYRVIATGVSADTDSIPSNVVSFTQPACALQWADITQGANGKMTITYAYPPGACGAGALRTDLYRADNPKINGWETNWFKVAEGGITGGVMTMEDIGSCRNGPLYQYLYKLVGVLSDRTTTPLITSPSNPMMAACAAARVQLLDFDSNPNHPNQARLEWAFDGAYSLNGPALISETVWKGKPSGPWAATSYKKGDWVPIDCGDIPTQYRIQTVIQPQGSPQQTTYSHLAQMRRPCVDDPNSVALTRGTSSLRLDYVFNAGPYGHDGMLFERRFQKPDSTWTDYGWVKSIANAPSPGHYVDPVPGADHYAYRIWGYKDVIDPYTSAPKRWRSETPLLVDGVPAGSSACNPEKVLAAPEFLGGGIWGCPAAVPFTDKGSVCAPGCQVATADQWSHRSGCQPGSIPKHSYWTNDDLHYNGTSTDCWASTSGGASCPANQPMRICPAESPDPEGNVCNWNSCSFQNDWRANDYFGGCSGNVTAGVLCICPADIPNAQANTCKYNGCNTATVPAEKVEYMNEGMAGCAGKVPWANRASLCAAGWHACSAQEWVNLRGNKVPSHHYWTNDNLLWTGSPNSCSVSTSSGSSCGANPMLVCTPSQPDLEGNTCTWTGCGLGTTTNQFFGGCPSSSTAGTLCCRD